MLGVGGRHSANPEFPQYNLSRYPMACRPWAAAGAPSVWNPNVCSGHSSSLRSSEAISYEEPPSGMLQSTCLIPAKGPFRAAVAVGWLLRWRSHAGRCPVLLDNLAAGLMARGRVTSRS